MSRVGDPRVGANGHGAPAASWPSFIGTASEIAVVRATERLLACGGARVLHSFEMLRGNRLHVMEAGAGEAMVLLHGAGGGAANWFAIIEPFSRHFRVLAPDLPGFAFSAALPLTVPLGDAVARELVTWLDARGERVVHLLGTSLGGLIALRLAQQLGSRVRTLTLLDSAGLGKGLPFAVRLATLPALRSLAGSTSRLGMELFFRTYLTSSPVPPDRRRALIDYITACARAGGGETLARSMADFASLRGQHEVLGDDELRTIETRTLILWGVRDRFLPIEHGRRAAMHLPRSTFVPLSGIGHSPNWEAPERVARDVLAFAIAAS